MVRDPNEEENNSNDEKDESPENSDKRPLKDYLAKAGVRVPAALAGLSLQCKHGQTGDHPELERGTLEDVPEVSNPLRKFVAQGTDVVDALRGTRDYMFAMEALRSTRLPGFDLKQERKLPCTTEPKLFEEKLNFDFEVPTGFFKDLESPFSEGRYEIGNPAALKPEYVPRTGTDVRGGIVSLKILGNLGENRDIFLQRRLAYELAVSDHEAGLAEKLRAGYASFGGEDLVFGHGDASTEAEPESTYGCLDLGNKGVDSQFRKDIKPRKRPGYDPKAGKGQKPGSE